MKSALWLSCSILVRNWWHHLIRETRPLQNVNLDYVQTSGKQRLHLHSLKIKTPAFTWATCSINYLKVKDKKVILKAINAQLWKALECRTPLTNFKRELHQTRVIHSHFHDLDFCKASFCQTLEMDKKTPTQKQLAFYTERVLRIKNKKKW